MTLCTNCVPVVLLTPFPRREIGLLAENGISLPFARGALPRPSRCSHRSIRSPGGSENGRRHFPAIFFADCQPSPARCSDPEWVRVQPVNVGLHRRHRGSGVPMDGRSSLSGRRKACSMPFALSCLSVWTVWQSAQCDAELVPGGCGGQRCRVSVTVV